MSHITTIDGELFIPEDQLCHIVNAVEEFCPDLELIQGQSNYRTWKDNHGGRLVGDWPVPAGWNAEEVGNNAHHVIRVTDKALQEKFKGIDRNASSAPYEIGIVPMHVERDEEGNVLSSHPDPNGKEYSLVTDWYMNANGLMSLPGVGTRKQIDKKKEMVFGELYMHYRMSQAKATAEQRGDTISFEKQKDGTYIGTVDTQARIGM